MLKVFQKSYNKETQLLSLNPAFSRCIWRRNYSIESDLRKSLGILIFYGKLFRKFWIREPHRTFYYKHLSAILKHWKCREEKDCYDIGWWGKFQRSLDFKEIKCAVEKKAEHWDEGKEIQVISPKLLTLITLGGHEGAKVQIMMHFNFLSYTFLYCLHACFYNTHSIIQWVVLIFRWYFSKTP